MTVNPRQRAAAFALVGKVAQLDLGDDLLADARAAFDRARHLEAEFAGAYRGARDFYGRLRDDVAAGRLAPGDALGRLAAISPTTATVAGPREHLAERLQHDVIDAVEADAVAAASRDADRVHDALSDRAAEIVAAATEATGTLFDLGQYVAEIQRCLQRPEWHSETAGLKGWPRFDLSAVDPLRLGIVGALRDLNARMRALHDTAHVLEALAASTVSVLYRTPPARRTESYLTRWVPPELQLAVAARLEWTPGLWRATDARPRPGDPETGETGATRKPHNPMRPDGQEQLVRDLTRGAVADVGRQQRDAAILRRSA